MSLTFFICFAFILGYLCIALESVLKINKAAIALLMFVACWTIFMVGGPLSFPEVSENLPEFMAKNSITDEHNGLLQFVNALIEKHLGSTATTLFFLMGAMTIVELVDQCGGFNFVRNSIKTRRKRVLLWRVAFMTFVLSAILDNLTTSIVMIMILRKLVPERNDRLIYAALVIIAANSGGAFSPIGDVTTIMLWNKGVITAAGVIIEIIIPSLISMVIPAYLLSLQLHGKMELPDDWKDPNREHDKELTKKQRKIVFFLGVGGLIFVPIFKSITHLPPFVGILLVLGLLWTVTEVFYRDLEEGSHKGTAKRVTDMLTRIDMSTILFFLGILMAVACLETIGVLNELGVFLNDAIGNDYIITGVIGVLSSIVDNVPLVAGCMGMYTPPTADALAANPELASLAVDGVFWQALAYCAGVGGSMLIIGSAAGVVVMGLEKISFGWYMKKITWIAFVGYIAGLISYWALKSFLFPALGMA